MVLKNISLKAWLKRSVIDHGLDTCALDLTEVSEKFVSLECRFTWFVGIFIS